MGTLDVAMTDGNRWLQLKDSEPDHALRPFTDEASFLVAVLGRTERT